MKIKTIMTGILFLSILAPCASAHPYFVGYSGAPGSNGTCSGSCHGTSGGTIQVNGFPSEYVPGQTYDIMISHSGGISIKQFNGSCRIGNGSQNAGVISSGSSTETYNTSGETNGIHMSTTDMNSCMFHWTAPQSGTGEVRLYLAGHQGSRSGQNTVIQLVSVEQATGIDEDNPAGPPNAFVLKGCYPNPFNAATVIKYTLTAPADIRIVVYNVLGRKVAILADCSQQAGEHSLVWNASDQPSGVYFARLETKAQSKSIKMVLLK